MPGRRAISKTVHTAPAEGPWDNWILSSEPSAARSGSDLFGIAVGEVGDIAFADVAEVAAGLAEEDGPLGA